MALRKSSLILLNRILADGDSGETARLIAERIYDESLLLHAVDPLSKRRQLDRTLRRLCDPIFQGDCCSLETFEAAEHYLSGRPISGTIR